MATSARLTTYTWQAGDTLRRVAARLMTDAGSADALAFGEAIRVANLPGNVPTGLRGLIDFVDVPEGILIVVPHAS